MPRLVIGLSGPGPAQKNRQVSHDKIGLTEDVTEESFRPATSDLRRPPSVLNRDRELGFD
jgi:hypothetical protein